MVPVVRTKNCLLFVDVLGRSGSCQFSLFKGEPEDYKQAILLRLLHFLLMPIDA